MITNREEAVLLRRKNPYRREQKIQWSTRLKILFSLALLLFTVGLLIYHPFFRIDHVDISGLERIQEKEFEQSITGVIDFRRFFVFPGNNYFLVNLSEIHDILLDRFPLETLRVQKTFPGTITVSVQEKISTIIYDNGSTYSTIGLDGKIVEALRRVGEEEWALTQVPLATTTASSTPAFEEVRSHRPDRRGVTQEYGDFPILYDRRHGSAEVNQQVVTPEMVAGTIAWFQAIHSHEGLGFEYMIVDDERGNARLILPSGAELYVRLSEDMDRQIQTLTYLLKEEITGPFSYVDLRYGDRIYWK